MKQTIVFVLENFYPDYRAGSETYVLNLAKGLLHNHWQVSVIIAAVGKESYAYNHEGINVYALAVPQKISTAELNGLQVPSNLGEFVQTLHVVQPQVIHFHSFSRSFSHAHLKAAYDFGAKVFFTAHLGGIFCARSDLQLFGKQQCNAKVENLRCTACYASQKHGKLISYAGAFASLWPPVRKINPALNLVYNKLESLRYLSNYSHRNIAIARWIEKAFRINHIQNTVFISQAIETAKFQPVNNKKADTKIRLGFIGRMNPSKGLYLLMDALVGLQSLYDLHCITIADQSEPDYYQEMKQRFAQLGYNLWQEKISHDEISNAMNNWNLMVLPSHHEVAPLTILEAYSKRIPVLGSDYPAIAEMIEEGRTGWLFRNKDAGHLAQKLKEIAENRHLLPQFSENMSKVKDIAMLVQEHKEMYHRQIL